MKEEIVNIIFIGIIVIASFFAGIIIEKYSDKPRQSCTKIRADINEMRRFNLETSKAFNETFNAVNELHDAVLYSDYDYGIDEMPIVPYGDISVK